MKCSTSVGREGQLHPRMHRAVIELAPVLAPLTAVTADGRVG